MKEEGNIKYKEWQDGKILDIDFLGHVFKNINLEENVLHKDILELEIDPYIKQIIEVKEIKEHWAEKYYQSLLKKGIEINDRRFDDTITRGEIFALLDRLLNR